MGIERRRHARIAVDQSCTLQGSAGTVEATLRDISMVGAKVVSARPAAAELERVELSVEPAAGHGGVRVEARIMYQRERDGVTSSGIQFMGMDAEVHRRVTELVEAMLFGEGGGQREHPRISHRVEVVCATKGRARAVLQDISRGGVRLTLGADQSVVDGQAITVTVSVGKLDKTLELRGHVVRVVTDAAGVRHAGVRLGPLDDGTEKLLYQLLKILVGSEK